MITGVKNVKFVPEAWVCYNRKGNWVIKIIKAVSPWIMNMLNYFHDSLHVRLRYCVFKGKSLA